MKLPELNPIRGFISFLAKLFEPISHLFLWSSGADLAVLEKVPTEKSKYYGIGGTIVFTALMATFAGGYAFYTAFKNETLAIFFGIFWGALIFNLDRYIVSTFGVGDGKRTISRQELVEGLPRILMAIILGLVISTPLELKIFEREIAVKIEELKFEKNRELQESDSLFWQQRNELQQQITTLNSQLANSIEAEGELQDQRRSTYQSDLDRLRIEESRIESDLTSAKQVESSYWTKYQRAKKDTSLTAYQKGRARQRYVSKRNERVTVENDLDSVQQEIKQLLEYQQSDLAGVRENYDNVRQTTKQRLESLKSQLALMDSQANTRKTTYEQTSQTYDGFAAHLEAMSMVADEHTSVRIAKTMITLLFVFIEIAPILFKMMTERGPYDDVMDQLKYEAKLRQDLKRSELNKDANVELELSTQKAKQKIEVELASNKKLLQYIADAQLELTYEAINSWKEKEAAKVKVNDEGGN